MFTDRELELLHESVNEKYLKENAKSKVYPVNARNEKEELARELRELRNKINSLILCKK